jgi:hypothetical protein
MTEGTQAPSDPSITKQVPRSILILGAILAVFDAVSPSLPFARRGLAAGRRGAPPVYAQFRPNFSPYGVFALLAGALLVYIAWRLMRAHRVRPALFLGASVLLMFTFAIATVGVDGRLGGITAPLVRNHPPDYHVDARMVHDYGYRTFIKQFPALATHTYSIHSATHPPGPVVVIAALEDLFPDHAVPRAMVIAFLSALVLVPTYFIARRVAGDRGAVIAVLLLAVAPSPILHAFTSLDAVFATAMVTAVLLLMRGAERDAPLHRAVVAGFVVGLLSILTYAISFLAAFGVLYAIRQDTARATLKRLAAMAVGGVAGLLLLRVVTGFDLWASYRAGYEVLTRYPGRRLYLYWVFGNVVVWLTFAGAPMAALALREVWRKRPWHILAMVLPLLVFYALPGTLTHIIPGETERTLQFVYPLAAAAAGAFLVRWERRRGAPGPGWISALVAITAGQTIAMEAVYRMYW